MRQVRAVNVTRGAVLADVRVAERWWQRARGMLGRPAPAADEGMLLVPCRSVHMFGMGYPLDVAFLDGGGTIVELRPRLAPGAGSGWIRGARMALELAAGTLERTGTSVGDVIRFRPED